MPRVIKHPEVRRSELIAIASALFARNGYEATSVDDIVREAKLSKGAFYHHFASKEALLEALAASIAEAALAGLGDVLTLPGLTAVERLDLFLRRGRSGDVNADIATFGAIFRPESLGLYHRLHRAVTRVMVGPLARIVEQGVAEGAMRSSDPRSTAEIILAIGPVSHDAIADLLSAPAGEAQHLALTGFGIRMVQQGLAVDRILGLADGTLSFWDDEAEAKWRSALAKR